ncbi:class I SAM-dependent methyltransferase [Mycobacterium marseillense]|uniref:class I SAM-dependent methyltransferase n=1 Tax=Mycobacterium marseillense TaxID=701042 RepID=UPI001F504081|nr:class I SAM-dependent methyltransferase [Mycobacterium marseillense]
MTEVQSSPQRIGWMDICYREGIAPWDIGESQQAIRQLAALGAVEGNVLDPGCGTGWHAIEYARRGCAVTGIDIAATAIERARHNAETNDVSVIFETGDVTQLAGYDGYFDTVVDSKCFDNIASPESRRLYVEALHRSMKPGAGLFMFAFGPGSVNDIHNHVDFVPDFETAAGIPTPMPFKV